MQNPFKEIKEGTILGAFDELFLGLLIFLCLSVLFNRYSYVVGSDLKEFWDVMYLPSWLLFGILMWVTITGRVLTHRPYDLNDVD